MWRAVFWVAALGVIAAYLFFWILGAFHIGDAVWLTVLVLLLAAAWVVHAVLGARHADDLRDPRLVHARERRGF
jgi:hypothetical protein